jgi:hypothetical protein
MSNLKLIYNGNLLDKFLSAIRSDDYGMQGI